MNDFNQNVNQETPHGFFTRKRTILLIVLAIVLAIESVWAFNFLASQKTGGGIERLSFFPNKTIATYTLEPQSAQVTVGEEFTLVISADLGGRTVNGMDAVISYDPSMLQVVDSDLNSEGIQVANGDLFSSLLYNQVDNDTGTITITASRISPDTPPITINGILAAITFEAVTTGETSINIVFDPSVTSNSNITEAKTSENILTGVTNATITILP